MSSYRNIYITVLFSSLLHFAILYFSPFDLSAHLPTVKETKISFKINRPPEVVTQPVQKKVLSPPEIPKPKPKKPLPDPQDPSEKITVIKPEKPAEEKVPEVKEITPEIHEEIKMAEFKPAEEPADTNEKEISDFNALVLERIEKKKLYPEIARKMGIEGSVLVGFTILPDGSVYDIEILSDKKCHKLLKNAAVKTIERAAPFQPVPLSLKLNSGFRMKIKIAYKIT